jgi:DNA-binding FadR family transcriptional regulator
MSEAERPDRLSGRRITVDDIRALAGPATPHFALQIRNRIRRLIEPLAAEDPARREGERQIERLTELAAHSGEPRGAGSASGSR